MFYCFARLSCARVEKTENIYTVTRFSLMVYLLKSVTYAFKVGNH